MEILSLPGLYKSTSPFDIAGKKAEKQNLGHGLCSLRELVSWHRPLPLTYKILFNPLHSTPTRYVAGYAQINLYVLFKGEILGIEAF